MDFEFSGREETGQLTPAPREVTRVEINVELTERQLITRRLDGDLCSALDGQPGGQAAVVQITREAESRIVGIGRRTRRSGKQEGIGVKGGCQIVGASTALLGVQERHLRKGKDLIG